MTTPPTIRHDAANQCFSTEVDGSQARLEYQREGDVLDLVHTIVPDAIGGRGIASKLTLAAFEYARAEGLHVRPTCSYVAAWSERHPEFSQLLV